MLKLAYSYREKLNQAWERCVFDGRNKYYNAASYWGYKIELEESSWSKIQMVSVDEKDEVRGYFSASLDRGANIVTSIGAINFFSINYTFSKDFFEFLKNLFVRWNFDKIEWTVVVGNPAEKLYDKIVAKYNGRIVGVRERSVRLDDGKLYDHKLYEIFKEDYMARL